MKLDSCIDFGCQFDGNLDISPATMFLDTGKYWISGPYYPSISLHRNTLSVFNFYKLDFMVSIYS